MSTTLRKAPWTAELYARAVASAILPGFVWGGGDVLPSKGLGLAGVRFTADRIAAYRQVCGGTGPGLPPAMPHLPGFPLALSLMTARDFPMSALGMVHIANRIEVLSELKTDGLYDIDVNLGNPLRHPKGTQFDVITTATVGEEVVWTEASTYLSRGTKLAGVTAEAERTVWPERTADAQAIEIEVPADIGRRYAGVSGDRNPIHLHGLSARAFGFRTAIAHGMWTLARCLAEIEAELPDQYVVTTGFFKPIFLPATCTLWVERGDSIRLWMMSGESLHAAVEVA